MTVTLFGGPKLFCKTLSVRQLDSMFTFEKTNLVLNAIKNAGGNNVAIICYGNRINQGFFKCSLQENLGAPLITYCFCSCLFNQKMFVTIG